MKARTIQMKDLPSLKDLPASTIGLVVLRVTELNGHKLDRPLGMSVSLFSPGFSFRFVFAYCRRQAIAKANRTIQLRIGKEDLAALDMMISSPDLSIDTSVELHMPARLTPEELAAKRAAEAEEAGDASKAADAVDEDDDADAAESDSKRAKADEE